MDDERKLELIKLLIDGGSWKAVMLIGRELLDIYYPDDIFTGVSGDPGPQYIVALRDALNRIEGKADHDLPKADDARGILSERRESSWWLDVRHGGKA